MRRSPLLHDLLELAWVILFLDLIILLSGVLVAGYAGPAALLLAAAFAALVTLTMAVAAGANLLVIRALRPRDRRRRRAEAISSITPQ